MKLKRGDSIEVFWTDACSYGGWHEPYTEGSACRNVGIFVSRGPKGLCLARGMEKNDFDLVLGPCFIPKGMIKKIRRLR
jgi:hypothetical protein